MMRGGSTKIHKIERARSRAAAGWGCAPISSPSVVLTVGRCLAKSGRGRSRGSPARV